MIAPGALVEFFQDKKILCGLCLKADKKSLHLLSEENREVGIPPQRVLLAVGGFLSPTALREEVVARLRGESARREEIKAAIEVADLWELLADEPGQYKPEELTATYFGTSAGTDQVSGMLRALRDDRIYFERKTDLYVPNGRERVQQLLDSQHAELNKQREREEMVTWLQAVWARRDGMVAQTALRDPECLPKYLDWFKDVALWGAESNRFKEVSTLLQRAGIQQRDGPFQVLVRARVWKIDENLHIHKHRIPVDFPADVLAEADSLAARGTADPSWRTPSRIDLTALHAITIDDEHTVETDDAISIRKLDTGWEVGIHIADPAEFVTPGTALDKEALHRGTSIYFPDMKVPMLPAVIGTDLCSLRPLQARPALSVLAVLGEDGELIESSIVESIVSVQEKLTYDLVDEALRDDTDARLRDLYKLADARRARRKNSGAFFIPFPSIEVYVHSEPDGTRQIDVRREEYDIPSHVLVSEFMILANEAVSRFCVAHQIPAVYRGQPPPLEPIAIGDTFTALDGFKIRRLLRKGETSLDPIRHSGLGIDAYMQFTSPIRRYLDLVMHRQIKQFLREGRPMYSRQDLEKISTVTGSSCELAETMERARKSYWIFKHLEESLWQERRASVLQVFPDRYHVQLNDSLVETDCPSVPGASIAPGDVIDVKIELVWPRDAVLRVSAMAPRGPAVRNR